MLMGLLIQIQVILLSVDNAQVVEAIDYHLSALLGHLVGAW